MRSRLFSGVVAVAAAIGIGVVAPARPAHAVVDWPALIADVALAAANGGGGGTGPNPELEAAKREIIAAIQASQAELETRLETLASAEVQACVRSKTRGLANIDQFDPVTLEVFALDADGCAALATEYFRVVGDSRIANQLGFLINPIYAVAITAMAKAGFNVRVELQDAIAANEAVVNRFRPTCFEGWSRTETNVYEVYCYIGTLDGTYYRKTRKWDPIHGWLSPPIDVEYVRDLSGWNTSYKPAKDALPGLRAALARM